MATLSSPTATTVSDGTNGVLSPSKSHASPGPNHNGTRRSSIFPAGMRNLIDIEEPNKEEPKSLGVKLIEAVKNGNLKDVKKLLEDGADVDSEDEKKWTSLMWASCNGEEDIVKVLLRFGAASRYVLVAPKQTSADEGRAWGEDRSSSKKKTLVLKTGSYTPLHWAAFKGHLKVVWLLIQAGLSPVAVDDIGNTVLHQAVAGGARPVVQCLLQHGCDLECKNGRGHSPLALCADPDVRVVIQNAANVTCCTHCGLGFDVNRKRFLCSLCDAIFCDGCCSLQWIFETITSTDKSKPVCYCYPCNQTIESVTAALSSAMESNDFEPVNYTLNQITEEKLPVDVKLVYEARRARERLETEQDIRQYIAGLQELEDVSKFQHAIDLLMDKIENGQSKRVSKLVVAQAEQEIKRLSSEKHLRVLMGKKYMAPTDADIHYLETAITQARFDGVNKEKLLDTATALKRCMLAEKELRECMVLVIEYPKRPVDPEAEAAKQLAKPSTRGGRTQTKAPQARSQSAPAASRDRPVTSAKKKKKKEKFIIPAWAIDLEAFADFNTRLESSVQEATEAGVMESMIQDANNEIKRMKVELKLRRDMLEEEKRLKEEKKAKKKADKGKAGRGRGR